MAIGSWGPVITIYTSTSNTTQVTAPITVAAPDNLCLFFRINHPTCTQYKGFYELSIVITGLHWFALLLLLVLIVADKIRERKGGVAAGDKTLGRGATLYRTFTRVGGPLNNDPNLPFFSGFQLFLLFACLGLLGWGLANTFSVFVKNGVVPVVHYFFSGVGTFFYYMAAVQFVDLVLRTSPADEFWRRLQGADMSTLTRKSRMKFVRETLLQLVAPFLVGFWVLLWVAGGVLNGLTFDGGFPYLKQPYLILTFVAQVYLLICWLFLLGAIVIAREAWKLNIKKAKDALAFSASQVNSQADFQPPSTPGTVSETSKHGRTDQSIDDSREVTPSRALAPVAPTRGISYAANINKAYGGGSQVPPLPSPMPSSTSGPFSPRGQQPNQYFSPIPTFAQQNPFTGTTTPPGSNQQQVQFARAASPHFSIASGSTQQTIVGNVSSPRTRRPSGSPSNYVAPTSRRPSGGSEQATQFFDPEARKRYPTDGSAAPSVLASSQGSMNSAGSRRRPSVPEMYPPLPGQSRPEPIPGRRPSMPQDLASSSGSAQGGSGLEISQFSVNSSSSTARPQTRRPSMPESQHSGDHTPNMSRQSSAEGLLFPSSSSWQADTSDVPYGPRITPLATVLTPQKPHDYAPDSDTFQRLTSPAWPVRPSWEQQQHPQEPVDSSGFTTPSKAVGPPGRDSNEPAGARRLRGVLRRGQRTLDLLVIALTVFNLFSVGYAVCLVYYANATPEGRWPTVLYYFTLVVNYSLAMFTFLVIGVNNLGKLFGVIKEA
ncbi:hypothetical protein BJ742DRAFT_825004 [Cladochytrium replicatum]|nr:hypothetical protein BJ742DRAFT_825004 [Cladochytrium replicatum]